MVFVAVGDEEGFDFGPVIFQIGIVGDDVIDPGEVGLGEANARVDEDDGTIGFETIRVFTHLTESAEGKDINRGFSHEKAP